jgi:hypothetical protein
VISSSQNYSTCLCVMATCIEVTPEVTSVHAHLAKCVLIWNNANINVWLYVADYGWNIVNGCYGAGLPPFDSRFCGVFAQVAHMSLLALACLSVSLSM